MRKQNIEKAKEIQTVRDLMLVLLKKFDLNSPVRLSIDSESVFTSIQEVRNLDGLCEISVNW